MILPHIPNFYLSMYRFQAAILNFDDHSMRVAHSLCSQSSSKLFIHLSYLQCISSAYRIMQMFIIIWCKKIYFNGTRFVTSCNINEGNEKAAKNKNSLRCQILIRIKTLKHLLANNFLRHLILFRPFFLYCF